MIPFFSFHNVYRVEENAYKYENPLQYAECDLLPAIAVHINKPVKKPPDTIVGEQMKSACTIYI